MVSRRGLLVVAVLIVGSFAAGFVVFGDGGPKVPRPSWVPASAPYVDGQVEQVGGDFLVIKPARGRPVELVVTLQLAGRVDLPHLINFHQAPGLPVRVYYERRGGRLLALGDADLPLGPQPLQRF